MMDNCQILKQQLKSAYRKYKNHTYYDSYGAVKRVQLAQFEEKHFRGNEDYSSDCADNYFNDLAEKLLHIDKRKELFDKLLQNIGVLCYPKKLKGINEGDSDKKYEQVLGNLPEEKNRIDRVHYFIDLSVETHIIGVLWILRCGWLLDNILYKNCYGNRLNRTVIDNLPNFDNNDYIDFSPFLFQPYWKRYQSWRDEALDAVTTLLDKKNDAIMITLDLKDYYYSSLIDFEMLRQDISDAKKNNNIVRTPTDDCLDNELSVFIENIFREYSKKFKRKNNDAQSMDPEFKQDDEKPMIPLGFLPSLIIANWNLFELDMAILENVLPDYYGRYVDDILIVLPLHEKSKFLGLSPICELNASQIIEKYFSADGQYPKNNIFRLDKDIISIDCGIQHYKNLAVQSKKVKMFSFSHYNSRVMIENFKSEIAKNTSEFRLMHEKEELYRTLGKKIYRIEYSDTINKIRSIENLEINKYELSKILSWLVISSFCETDNESRENYMRILEAFEGSNAIELMILWEKLIGYLYLENKHVDIKNIIDRIITAIDKLEFPNKEREYQIINIDELELVKDTLTRNLYYVLIRVLTLRTPNNLHISNILRRLEDKFDHTADNATNIIKAMKFASLQNTRLMKYPLVDYLVSEAPYDMISPSEGNFNDFAGFCFPRYVQFHECILHELNKLIFNKNGDINIYNYLDKAKTLYQNLNYGGGRCANDFYRKDCVDGCPSKKCDESKQHYNLSQIRVGHEKRSAVKIGLIATRLNEKDFENNLKGRPNRTTKRLDAIAAIINEAIAKDVQLLIMPEVYIPYEWISYIVEFSRRHQMAMIFGVEHVTLNSGKVGNFIAVALPSESDEGYYNCTLALRLKNHYAPEELREFAKYKLKPLRSIPVMLKNDL